MEYQDLFISILSLGFCIGIGYLIELWVYNKREHKQ